MVVSVHTDAGNDYVSLNGVWHWNYKGWGSSPLGPGDDYARFGPGPVGSVPFAGNPGLLGLIESGTSLWAGEGNDTIDTLNLRTDSVHCGDGADKWTADPSDNGEQDFGPPTEDCETRTPPLP